MLLGLLTAWGKIFVKWDYGVCSPWSLKANILDSLFCRFLSEAIVFVMLVLWLDKNVKINNVFL